MVGRFHGHGSSDDGRDDRDLLQRQELELLVEMKDSGRLCGKIHWMTASTPRCTRVVVNDQHLQIGMTK